MADADRSQELKELFWKELANSPFVMIGLEGVEDSRTRPWTAQIDAADDADKKDGGTIYFFGAKSEAVVAGLSQNNRVVCTYVAKVHDLFAHIHGTLEPVTDRAMVELLWQVDRRGGKVVEVLPVIQMHGGVEVQAAQPVEVGPQRLQMVKVRQCG